MLNRKGQSTLEYALIIAVVVAGLLLMQYYMRRGFAGKMKSTSDDLGQQFDPSVYSANLTFTETSRVRKGAVNRVITSVHNQDEVKTRAGRESLNAWTNNADLYAR